MWEILLTLALQFTLIRQPILLSYQPNRSDLEFSVSIGQSLLFALDIVLNFRTGIVNIQSDTIILDPTLVAKFEFFIFQNFNRCAVI